MKREFASPALETSLAIPSTEDHLSRCTKGMAEVLEQLRRLGGKPIEDLTPEQARQQPGPADAVAALMKKRGQSANPEPVAQMENRRIPGPGGDIAIRIYTPLGTGPFPVVLYIHGGGWVLADLDAYDASPRALCNATGAVVVSAHYRLAPEHPFPASHDDTFAAYLWVRANATSFHGDPTRVAVAGESAGGNMAAAISLMARDRKVPLPVHQVLVYPVAGVDLDTASFKEHAHAKPLNRAMMVWFGAHEFSLPADVHDPRIDLLHTNLAGMPPTTLITAEIDPLRSGGELLASQLKAAGVSVEAKQYVGVTHEFFGMGSVLEESRDAVQFAARNLRKAFERDVGVPTSAKDRKEP
ncbi:MAG: alpha/beta hydrolase [Verrucomicrobiales bacterium]|nr:alpha/beta hydrolase [Verrucomicrobiales bacterium]